MLAYSRSVHHVGFTRVIIHRYELRGLAVRGGSRLTASSGGGYDRPIQGIDRAKDLLLERETRLQIGQRGVAARVEVDRHRFAQSLRTIAQHDGVVSRQDRWTVGVIGPVVGEVGAPARHVVGRRVVHVPLK